MKNLMFGDCLEQMDLLIEQGVVVDCVLTDPPYGTTACQWDSVIPFDKMWRRLNRLIKPNGAIILFGRAQFTAKLICSNLKNYKHKWVWNKKQTGSFANAKYMPLQIEEDILIFTAKGGKVIYYPIMRKGKMRKKGGSTKQIQSMSKFLKPEYYSYSDTYFPVNIIEVANCAKKKERIHPTQKPVQLMEYLIKTYTNEKETVLDFTMGSGSTGVAAINLNRNFIGIENNEEYFNIAKQRINKAIENSNYLF